MPTFEFTLSLVLDAKSKAEAKVRAKESLDNLKGMIGYAPFEVELTLDENSCEKVEYEEEAEDK